VRVDPFTNGSARVSVRRGERYVVLDPTSAAAVAAELYQATIAGGRWRWRGVDRQGMTVRVESIGEGHIICLQRGGTTMARNGSKVALEASTVARPVADALVRWIASLS
jgi:hypothetical protein